MITLLQYQPRGGWADGGELLIYLLFFIVVMIWSRDKMREAKQQKKEPKKD